MDTNVIRFRTRHFTWIERQLLITATQVWSEFTMPQSIIFDVTEDGEEYCVVLDYTEKCVAHIGFTKTRIFVDSAWFGYGEYHDIEELIRITMPTEYHSKYFEYKRKLA
jgi:hypothetical protein